MRRILPVAMVAATLVSGVLLQAQTPRTAETQLKAAQQKEEVEGDLKGAIEQYKKLAQSSDRALAARALVRMAGCYQKQGDAEAQKIYERVAREFGDQADSAAMARARLAEISRPAAATVRAARQIWTGKDVDPMGAPTADGRYLTFTEWTTGDLAIRDLRDGTNRRLTNTGGWTASGDYAENSVPSPDGRLVAYAWFVDKALRYELRIASTTPDPASVRVIHQSDQTRWVHPHAWTPDGKRILMTRQSPDRTSQLAFVSTSDGSMSVLKSLDWRSPERASLSPDGRSIAYDAPAGIESPARDIYVLAADGSRESVVVQGPANDHAPMWSPDGSRLIFLSDRTGRDALWSVRVAGDKAAAAPEFLNAEIGRVFPLGLTRNGALVYFSGIIDGGNSYIADLTPEGTVAGSPTLVSERFMNTNGGGAWSRDGSALAYYSRRGARESPGSTVLVIRSMKTGEERDIPLGVQVFPNPGVAPRWFGDGTLLVAARNVQKNRNEYYRLDPATARLELVHSVPMAGIPGGIPELSPDGAAIYCIDMNNERTLQRLTRYDLATRQTTVITSVSARLLQMSEFAVSPDGTQVAFLTSGRDGAALNVIPAGGGTPREVFRAVRWGDGSRFGSLAWTRDQRHLLFAKPEDDGGGTNILQGPHLLWRIPVAGGTPQKVGVAGEKVKLTHVHPDGTRIAFRSGVDVPSEVWVLENFLPTASARK